LGHLSNYPRTFGLDEPVKRPDGFPDAHVTGARSARAPLTREDKRRGFQ
jgi:hypothetical protein